MSMGTESLPPKPKSITGLAAAGTAAIANLLGGYVAGRLLAEHDTEGFFGHRFFLGPPILLLSLVLVLSIVGIVLIVLRSRETPGVMIRRGRFVALVFVWLIVLSVLVVAAIIEFDPSGLWRLSLASLALPFLVLSAIMSVPLLRGIPGLLRYAGVQRSVRE